MTIFGLNSPELFVLLVITLVILGTKRIEKGIDLFSRLLKFLLSKQSSFDEIDKKKQLTKEFEEAQEKERVIKKNEETINAKEKELTKKIEETQEKEDKSEERLTIAKEDIKEKKSSKTQEQKGIVKDKTVNKLKTKNPKRIVKDKRIIGFS